MRTKTTIFYIGNNALELKNLGPHIVHYSLYEVMSRIQSSNRIVNIIKIDNLYFVVESE